jgi:protein ImuB
LTRTACVWVPDWPVVAARRRDEALRAVPVVVRERIGSRDLVRAASAEARADGVTRGMRRREAEACCPQAVCIDADEADEARRFEAVARAVEQFTPRVVLDRPGRCDFPTRGPARYFGGDEPFAQKVRDAITAALDPDGRDIRVGIADGVFAARLAARHNIVVPPGESAAFVAPWPVTTLGDDELASLLVRLGLPTLGAVAALPPDAVLARFGSEGRRFHDLARGIDPGPPVLVAPPPDLVEQTELDPPAVRVDIAAFAAKELADRLCERLAERGLACTRVMIEAETEHGERLVRCWRHDASLTAGALVERVRWQLDGWVDTGSTTAGISLLRLVPDEVVPADGRQLGFWGGDQVAHDRADRALARVQGMVGYDAVTTAVVQGGRAPTELVRWVPWGEPREPALPLYVGTEACAWPGALPAPFPARVFDPPIAAELTGADGRPVTVTGRGEQRNEPARVRSAVVNGTVTGWTGPWVHDVRWWDPAVRRRCVRYQLLLGQIACIAVVENGRAAIEAIYD